MVKRFIAYNYSESLQNVVKILAHGTANYRDFRKLAREVCYIKLKIKPILIYYVYAGERNHILLIS